MISMPAVMEDNHNLEMKEAPNDMSNDAATDYKVDKQIVEADFVIFHNL